MPAERFADYKGKLELLRDELQSLLSNADMNTKERLIEIPRDLSEQSSINFSTELMFTQTARNKQVLRKVEAALERIRNGTYGECRSCGEVISSKRLEAVPFASHCRACQEDLEKRVVTIRRAA